MENQQVPLPHLNDLQEFPSAESISASAAFTLLSFAPAGAGHPLLRLRSPLWAILQASLVGLGSYLRLVNTVTSEITMTFLPLFLAATCLFFRSFLRGASTGVFSTFARSVLFSLYPHDSDSTHAVSLPFIPVHLFECDASPHPPPPGSGHWRAVSPGTHPSPSTWPLLGCW